MKQLIASGGFGSSDQKNKNKKKVENGKKRDLVLKEKSRIEDGCRPQCESVKFNINRQGKSYAQPRSRYIEGGKGK